MPKRYQCVAPIKPYNITRTSSASTYKEHPEETIMLSRFFSDSEGEFTAMPYFDHAFTTAIFAFFDWANSFEASPIRIIESAYLKQTRFILTVSEYKMSDLRRLNPKADLSKENNDPIYLGFDPKTQAVPIKRSRLGYHITRIFEKFDENFIELVLECENSSQSDRHITFKFVEGPEKEDP